MSDEWKIEHAECLHAVREIKRSEDARVATLQEIYDRGVKKQEEISAALAAENARLAARLARMEKALESAYTDLVGFEGYFTRLGSMGTVASVQLTLNKIDDALRAEPPQDGAREAVSDAP